ncbi:hypothetical protein KJ903_05080 [Patescibacteria group bacterium]|nr:hypothetical protein [Patescibacteria group bacterium]
MQKQTLLDIIQNSNLAVTTKQELTAKIEKEGASAPVVKSITKTLKEAKDSLQQSLAQHKAEQAELIKQVGSPDDDKAAEFKAREVNRLVGEKMRQVNQQYVENLQKLEKLTKHITNQSMQMMEEDKQQAIKASLDDIK